MAQPPLTYKQRAQIAILANTAIRSVDRYFEPKPLHHKTRVRARIAAALRDFGRADLVRAE
jgi:hypothetical protein